MGPSHALRGRVLGPSALQHATVDMLAHLPLSQPVNPPGFGVSAELSDCCGSGHAACHLQSGFRVVSDSAICRVEMTTLSVPTGAVRAALCMLPFDTLFVL